MKKNRFGKYLLLGLVILAWLSASGCESPKSYAKYAKIMMMYTETMDQLLVTAEKLRVDNTSIELLDSKNKKAQIEATADEAAARVKCKDRDDADVSYINEVNNLRKANALVGKYFQLMLLLAESDAPASLETSLNGITGNLSKIIGTTSADTANDFGQIVIDQQITGRLRKELETDQVTIRTALNWEVKTFVTVGKQMDKKLNNLKTFYEEQKVIKPYLAKDGTTDKNYETWMNDRKKILLSLDFIPLLEEGQEITKQVQICFDNLLRGQNNDGGMNALLIDLTRLQTELKTYSQN